MKKKRKRTPSFIDANEAKKIKLDSSSTLSAVDSVTLQKKEALDSDGNGNTASNVVSEKSMILRKRQNSDADAMWGEKRQRFSSSTSLLEQEVDSLGGEEGAKKKKKRKKKRLSQVEEDR